MSWQALDDDGCSVNLKYVVSVERDPFKAKEGIARLVSGSTVRLKDVYPTALELVKIGHSPDVWVNAKYVCVVDIGFNRDAAYRDVSDAAFDATSDKYMQIRVETVLGEKHTLWCNTHEAEEVGHLAQIMATTTEGE